MIVPGVSPGYLQLSETYEPQRGDSLWTGSVARFAGSIIFMDYYPRADTRGYYLPRLRRSLKLSLSRQTSRS